MKTKITPSTLVRVTSAHTPGPWAVSGRAAGGYPIYAEAIKTAGIRSTQEYFKTLTVVTQRDANPVHGGGIDDATAAANARLIAAAPELLDALKTIAESEEHRGGSFVCDFTTLQSVARAAIAKATAHS